MLFIVYSMFNEIQSLFRLKLKYLSEFWSMIELGIIISSWSCIGIFILMLNELNQISSLFKETNGYVYIDLELLTYLNDVLRSLFGFCIFFGTIRFVRLCENNSRLSLFLQTLKRSTKELISFSMMFSIVFISFISLFYLLFNSQIFSCSTFFETTQMLFEMSLSKFDAHHFVNASPILGPICFSLFIFLVFFVCMSMFLSIIGDNFRLARDNAKKNHEEIFSFIWDRFLRKTSEEKKRKILVIFLLNIVGLRKPTEEELNEERDAKMRQQYFHPIENFPDKIDQLLDALNRVRSYLNS